MLAQMRRAAIFFSPALYEPFGLAVLEAAANGCALVLSDIPTFRELWTGAAVFVAARDAAGFAAAINRLADDPAEREALGRCAAARAQDFTLSDQAAHVRQVYRAALAPHVLAA
jgi:glycosyltransferase involved in cell wall biosynthesis